MTYSCMGNVVQTALLLGVLAMTYLEPDTCPTATEAEQRRHRRHLCIDGKIMRLAVRPEFRGRRALLFDVSVSGIGFLLQDALELGIVLVFEVQGPNGTDTVGRIARVRHCREHAVPADAPWLPPTPALSRFFRGLFGLETPKPEGHAWLVGCEFDRPLNEDELKQLVEQLTSISETPPE
jgi:hypothetical protein